MVWLYRAGPSGSGFCREEYAYYDGIRSSDANAIQPDDLLATLAMSSSLTADKIRSVHRWMSEHCDPILASIDGEADLLQAPPELLANVRALLEAAMGGKGILVAVATKVLHRKRPRLIPMMDSVLLGHYLSGPDRRRLLARTIEKASAASAADAVMVAMDGFKGDLEYRGRGKSQDRCSDLRFRGGR